MSTSKLDIPTIDDIRITKISKRSLPQFSHRAQFSQRDPLAIKQILYLLIFQGIGSGIINFGLNFLIAWAIYHNQQTIPFSGVVNCIIGDLFVTSFVIVFLCTIIGTILAAFDARKGLLVTPIDSRWLLHPAFQFLPKRNDWLSVFLRAVILAVGVTIFYVPTTILIIYLAAGHEMTVTWNYIVFKGIWGAAEGMLVTPFVAFIAIATRNP